VASVEEFIPRPQNDDQKKVERLIGERSGENSKRVGVDRRAYLASSMGLAAAFLAKKGARVPGGTRGPGGGRTS
jgi:hypothetical protein